MLVASLLGLALSALYTVFQWRNVYVLVVLVMLAQDPLRKLVPGQPVVFVGFVAVVFAAGWLGAWLNRVPLRPSVMAGWNRSLALPATLFLMVLAVQSIHSVARWENPMLPVLGGITYLAPLAAVVFAHQFAVRFGLNGIRRFFVLYVLLSIPWLLGIVAESSGQGWPILGEVGEGQIIYSFGLNKRAVAGFYRSAEVAAWHVGMVSCLLFMLINGRRLPVLKSLAVAAVVLFLLYVGTVTGRRKMLIYVAVFGVTYVILYANFLRGKARPAALAALAAVVGFGALLSLGPDPGELAFDLPSSRFEQQDWTLGQRDERAAWQARALTVFADIPERFRLLAYRPVAWAVEAHGWFGAGLGAGAQGAQHFGGGAAHFGGAAEGGLGKITLDLGIPGLVIFLWLALAIARELWGRLRALSVTSRPHAMLAFGLAGILVANVATFAVATQVFGDLFVLILIGSCLGFLIALPTLAWQALWQSQSMTAGMLGAAQPGDGAVGVLPSPIRLG
ncbi:MAG: hypothetical protein ACK4XK_04655 [Casimicrobiaceae bacterium]